MKHQHYHEAIIGESMTRRVFPWDSRLKTAAVLVFVFGLISLNNLWLLAISLAFVTGAAIMMRVPYKVLFYRWVLFLPFLVFMSIPLILGGGFPIPPARLFLPTRIALKAFASITSMVLLLTTQPLEEYIKGLAHMKTPPVFATILFLSYRYVYLFVEELKNMQKSLVSRCFLGGVNKQALKVYGELSGVMFIKSLDRAETVYRAMASRCFDGQLPSGPSAVITSRDIIMFFIPVAFIVLMSILEHVVI